MVFSVRHPAIAEEKRVQHLAESDPRGTSVHPRACTRVVQTCIPALTSLPTVVELINNV